MVMMFCRPHQDALTEALTIRGLSHLFAKGKADALRKAICELEGRGAENDPCPMMMAVGLIVEAAMNCGGDEVAEVQPDGTELCPVCLAEQNGVEPGSWIDGPADVTLQFFRVRGLVL